MNVTTRCFGLVAVWLLIASTAFGQGTSSAQTVHIFPQIADGYFPDGSSYYSFLTISNVNANATVTCTTTPSSTFPASRFVNPLTQTLVPYYTAFNGTAVNGPMTTGYVTIRCSQPVQASLFYSFYSRFGQPLGMATVFSAPTSYYALFPMLRRLRYGLAIANPSPQPVTLSIRVTPNNGAATIYGTITIPAQTQYVRFVEDLIPVPVAPANISEIYSSSVFTTFYLTGVIFDGTNFSTLVPATLPQ